MTITHLDNYGHLMSTCIPLDSYSGSDRHRCGTGENTPLSMFGTHLRLQAKHDQYGYILTMLVYNGVLATCEFMQTSVFAITFCIEY